jgi:exo-beta-1,3-glucanase (GH17 family)
LQAVDVVLMNDYPYWGGAAIDHAVSDLENGYRQMLASSAGKPVIISETGWPSCGDSIGQAVPSIQNAAAYFQEFTDWARRNNAARNRYTGCINGRFHPNRSQFLAIRATHAPADC